jgi:tRNA/rRNA methyltransferase
MNNTSATSSVESVDTADSQKPAAPAIILVEPTGPLNIGSIARSMRNFGLSDLRLVNPKTDHLGPESRRMAMRAANILETATIHETTRSALQGLSSVVALTARPRSTDTKLFSPAELLTSIATQTIGPKAEVGFLFGTEESGLSNEDLSLAHFAARIGTSEDYPSLNLAHAVTICCYEWSLSIQRAQMTGAADAPQKQEAKLQSQQFLELIDHAEQFFKESQFINASNRNARMRKFIGILQRSRLSASEGRFIRALFYFVSNRYS